MKPLVWRSRLWLHQRVSHRRRAPVADNSADPEGLGRWLTACVVVVYALVACSGALFICSVGQRTAWCLGSSLVVWRLSSVIRASWREPLDRSSRRRELEAMVYGWGMRVTLARGVGLVVLGGCSLSGALELNWLFFIYAAYSICDWLDGFLARHEGRTSRLGARLDGELDALGIIAISLALIGLHRLPLIYLLVPFGQPLLVSSIAIRRRLGLPSYPERLVANSHMRIYAGFQMALLVAASSPLVDAQAVTVVAWLWLWPTVSGFVSEWRAVSGQRLALPPMRAPFAVLEWPLPWLARVVLALCLLVGFLGGPLPVFAYFLVPCLVAVVLGVWPRLAACTICLVMGLVFQEGVVAVTVLAAASVVAILGPGWPRGPEARPSGWWAPEEAALHRRWGGAS